MSVHEGAQDRDCAGEGGPGGPSADGEAALRALLHRCLDGDAAPAEKARLCAALEADERARLMYASFAAVHAALLWEFAEARDEGWVLRGAADVGVAEPPAGAERGARAARAGISRVGMGGWLGGNARRGVALAACTALVVSAGVWAWVGPGFGAGGPGLGGRGWRSGRGDVAAREAASVGVVWREGEGPGEGGFLKGTTYGLASGRVCVRTARGALAVLNGPATFAFVDAAELRLDEGVVTAWAPSATTGEFSVRTAGAVVRDLGTEFLVAAFPEGRGTTVYVREGRVDVRARAENDAGARSGDGDGRVLAAGEAVEVTADGAVRGVDAAIAWSGAWPEQVRAQAEAAAGGPGQPGAAWRARAAELTADATLLLWLDGERASGGFAGGVRNRAFVRRAGDGAGAELAGEGSGELGGGAVRVWTSGNAGMVKDRFGEVGAVDCARAGGGVQVEVPGTFDRLTLAAWVRFAADAMPSGYVHRGVLMSRAWGEPGAVHWQAKETDFRLTFAHPSVKPHAVYDASRHDLHTGEWTMLAVTYDAVRGVVTHYHDGRVVAEEPVRGGGIPLRLGPCVVGATLPTTEDPEGVPMGGAVDDLMVWSRCLSAEEIGRLHEASRP